MQKYYNGAASSAPKALKSVKNKVYALVKIGAVPAYFAELLVKGKAAKYKGKKGINKHYGKEKPLEIQYFFSGMPNKVW